MKPIELRQSTTDDAQDLLRFRLQLYAETDFLLWQATELSDCLEDSHRYINSLVGRANSQLIVARNVDHIVGFVAARGHAGERRKHGTCLVLGVLKAHWSKGIGSRLLASINAWASAASISRLELTVRVDNARAIDLYLRHGFNIEGRRRAVFNIEGTYFDDYLMARILPLNESTSA